MADNIIKLAAVQDAGELPPGTKDALALIYAERHVVEFSLCGCVVALAPV